MKKQILIHKLFELGAVKFGQFTLKSGVISPFYIDLRLTISNPKLLAAIAECMHEKVRGQSYELVCGVPYTALPFATILSVQHNIPMVLKRKERKEYGTGKLLEGIFQPGQRCLVLEDVITSGQSIFETIIPLQSEGIVVEDIVVLVDREQGGRKMIENKGFRVHAICTITSIIEELLNEGKITKETVALVEQFISNHQTYA